MFGPNNSLKRKRSIFKVTSDTLCLPIAIAVCFLKLCKKVKIAEWETLMREDANRTILDNVIKYKTCPKSYYYRMLDKTKTQKQKEMAKALCRKANVPIDRPLGLNDITPFENLLDVNVNVISSKLGNKFVRVLNNPDLSNIFVYLVESDGVQHFHGIANMSGFFGANNFCETCLKPYEHKKFHSCETTCEVCGSKDCTMKNPLSCRSCHRECRSYECFERNRKREGYSQSKCETSYRCTT